MSKVDNRKVHYLGLNEHRRINWTDPINRACVAWAIAGLHIATIARWTHLTTGQVVYRLRKREISVGDYRRGEGARAQAIKNKYETSLQNAWKAS